MRLIFVNRFFHPDESATSQLLTDLCLHLAAAGHEVHVIASRQRHEDPAAMLPASETWQGIEVHRVAASRFGRMNLPGRAIDYLTFYASAGLQLWRTGSTGDVVIAETDPPLISSVAAWVCRRKRMKLVNWVQDLFPEIAQQLGVRVATGAPGRLMARLRDYSLRVAAANVALGREMAARLARLAPGTRIEVIHNWSDGRRVHPIDAPDNDVRAAWGLRDRFVVAYSGNMGRAHEFETILQACEALRDRDDIAFVFIGSGAQRASLEDEARKRGLIAIFKPFQPRETLAQTLAVADVHLIALHPGLEGLIVPSKFYGIAAAGRPAIFVGDRSGEIARLLEAASCGVSIETGDAIALARAIERMAAHPDEAREMGRRAHEVFAREFDLPHAMRHWSALLESL